MFINIHIFNITYKISGLKVIDLTTWFNNKFVKDILDKIKVHVSKVHASAMKINEMIDYIERGDIGKVKEAFTEIKKLEDEADEIKRSVMNDIANSVMHPDDREDFLRLVILCDDIVDNVKAASRKLEILVEADCSIDRDIMDILKRISSRLLNATEHVLKTIEVLPESIDKALDHISRVEDIEEEIDDLRDQGWKTIVTRFKGNLNSYALLIKEAVDDLERASDKCKDSVDTVKTIIITHK